MDEDFKVETSAERTARYRQRGFTTADARAAFAIRKQLLEHGLLLLRNDPQGWVADTAKLIADMRKSARRTREERRGA